MTPKAEAAAESPPVTLTAAQFEALLKAITPPPPKTELALAKERQAASEEMLRDVRKGGAPIRVERVPCKLRGCDVRFTLEIQSGAIVRPSDIEVDRAKVDRLVDAVLAPIREADRPTREKWLGWKTTQELFKNLKELSVDEKLRGRVKQAIYTEQVFPVLQLAGTPDYPKRTLADVASLIEVVGPVVVIHEGPAATAA